MEITLEQVEKVRSCTGASYEEAKAALEAAGGSVLDAVILLEQRGKGGAPEGGYSTREPSPPPEPEPARPHRLNWPEVWRALRSLMKNCLAISLEIWKRGQMTCMIPLIIAVILCVIQPYLCGALLLVGLCFGYRIHISGRGTEDWGEQLNQFADQVGDIVNDAVRQLRRDRNNTKK